MAWKRSTVARKHVVTTRLSDDELSRMQAAAGDRSVCEILQPALNLWLKQEEVKAPQICSYCRKRIGTVTYTRTEIERLPEQDRGDLTSHGCCPKCRDAVLAEDAA